jgi:hypothetical protein
LLTTVAALVVPLVCVVIAVARAILASKEPDTDLVRLAGLYLLLGPSVGLLIGVLLPLATNATGAWVVGAIAGAYLITAAGIGLTLPAERMEFLPWFVGGGAFGGGITGVALRSWIVAVRAGAGGEAER